MADVLAAVAALTRGLVVGAGGAVPGAVGIPGQAALGTSCTVGLTPVQPHLGHPEAGAHVECLLGERHQDGDAAAPTGTAPAGIPRASTMWASRGW